MFRKKKVIKLDLATFGNVLIAEFASAITNRSVAEGLTFEAKRNETLALQHIASAGAYNKVYVTPADIPPDQQAAIAKASVDAHMQKAQAIQVADYTDRQLHQAELRVNEKYKGLKVLAKVITNSPWPVDTCYVDAKGEYRMNEHGPKKVSGYIEDIDLRKNCIVIRPTRLVKVVNRSVQFHRIYIISPSTMYPLVSLTFA